MVKSLIDGDLLAYECSAAGQVKEPESGEVYIKHFDEVFDMLTQRVKEIVGESLADEEPTLYLTGDLKLLDHLNRANKRQGIETKVFRPNFRTAVAVTKPYKGNRKSEKPYHFDNIRACMLSEYNCIISDGVEADDKLCIDHYADFKANDGEESKLQTVLCSRDKDLRINPGLHYRWACGKQPPDGPTFVTQLGQLALSQGMPKKLRGSGLKFFYSQLITGDAVDNIAGLPRKGPVFAYKLLADCESELDCFDVVKEAYQSVYEDDWEKHLREMTDLLWMIREVNEDGTLKFYEWPKEENDEQQITQQ